MGYTSLLRSPKMEEQQVPNTIRFSEIDEETYVTDELEGFWGMEDEEDLPPEGKNACGQLNWDFMDCEGFSVGEEEESRDQKVADMGMFFQEHERRFTSAKGGQNCGFWGDDPEEKKVSLNLSLNYQEVLDAWSDRGPLRADEYSLSMANNGYMGEVPVMEEERRRREASVLRYKEKRQTRLFCKKIRYQVRKLNADKRPRLKGRFVKRVPEKMLKFRTVTEQS
ncbi:hypothetical protein RHSIM_Rhsim01G0240200 [Rhododendron simsii]|uniref:CCT domain-containing protein n=1 Tax=Rhododendron simsii TaxID=118357 RepID=A0A834HHT3_RHOSS|nr:hypothetical protein RHSIM_Rhsim01G0240200 [Rhododendron simsii]